MPGDGSSGDDDDIVAVVYDVINSELEFWKFDDSGNSWGTPTSIDTGFGQTGTEARKYKRLFDAASRHSDEDTIVAYWDDFNTGPANLRTVSIDHATPTITQGTNIVSGNNTALVGLLINQQNDDIYAAYLTGSSFGAGGASIQCVYQLSTDDMVTWDGEAAYGTDSDDQKGVSAGHTVGNNGGRFMPVWFNDDLTDYTVNDGLDIEITAAVALDTGWDVQEPSIDHPPAEVLVY